MSFNVMAEVTICNDFRAPQNKVWHCFPSISHEVMGPDAMIFVFWALSQLFRSPLSLSSRGFLAPLHFLDKGGVICISEVIDISPGSLDSSLCFFQPSISHDVLCIQVKIAGWQYTALVYSFSYLEPVCCSMSSSNCCSWPAYRFLKRQVRWSGIPISFRIFHSLLWSTQSKTWHSQKIRNRGLPWWTSG